MFKRFRKTKEPIVQNTFSEQLIEARKSNSNDLFSGLHRMELVAEFNGVKYINDSVACSVEETFKSIASVKESIVWIVGGYGKNQDYKMLEEIVKDKVSVIVCSGVDNDKIFEAFFETSDMVMHAKSLGEAVTISSLFAKNGHVVLFSPACPSYHTHENFEERGEEFRKSVENLIKEN
jgi:UDP-N-acetylmuramoylalanine--D-glutamate ligase